MDNFLQSIPALYLEYYLRFCMGIGFISGRRVDGIPLLNLRSYKLVIAVHELGCDSFTAVQAEEILM
ncbi:hypothetical protein SOVF_142370 isoform A [Spinacia oleracea]|nr:hypothetical protein SOVF_142370 isoform A [Spinacia oleracea]